MGTPKYWAYEASGILKPSVERYLRGEELTKGDISNLRSYIKQWIDSPVWDKNPYLSKVDLLTPLRSAAAAITTAADIDKWTTSALDAGIDPW